jgi:phosphatidylserine/phosphatidylglycerophosphate/cardiolipin synthase-like enzyme
VTDRMMSSGHIAHNKFVVYENASGTPCAVLTGSTNWTSTGLCAQANNAIVVEDRDIAATYKDYWDRLKAQCPPSGHATQDAGYRTENRKGQEFEIDGAAASLWFSPNTPQQRKPSLEPPARPPTPVDMAVVEELIEGAKTGILFLLFQPGSPSVLDAIERAQESNASLYVRGAATDPRAIGDYVTKLHRSGRRVVEVAAATAVEDQFAYWQKELLKTDGAHAIIHDKVLVIDPLSDHCVVVTGSHNLGYTASYANDENFLIVRGHRRLAEAYAVHVLDVYDHYRWRYNLERYGAAAFNGLTKDPDEWQGWYFADGRPEQEVTFWVGGDDAGQTA